MFAVIFVLFSAHYFGGEKSGGLVGVWIEEGRLNWWWLLREKRRARCEVGVVLAGGREERGGV